MLFFIAGFTLFVTSCTICQGVTVTTLKLDGSHSLDGLLVTPDGTLYGTEGFDGTRLFKISKDGTTSVVVDGLNGPIDLDYDSLGNLYLSTFNNQGLYKIVPDNPFDVSLFSRVNTGPSGVVVNRNTGDIFVSHYGSGFPGNGNSIFKVRPDGIASVFAQGDGLQVPVSLAIDENGNLYAPNIANARLFKITPEGDVSLLAQLPTAPVHTFNIGHIAYAKGNLYVTGNSSQPLIFRVSMDGEYSVIAGDGNVGQRDGNGLNAQFNAPNGIAASVSGDTLFVSELGQPNQIRIIALDQTTPTQDPGYSQSGFRLYQNSPNPIEGKTLIAFDIGERRHIEISVYSNDGRRIQTLLEQFLPAGRHEVEWDVKDLLPGSYFYRMQAGHFSAQKKALILSGR